MKKILSRIGLLSVAGMLAFSSLSALFSVVVPAPSASAGASTCTWTGSGANANWSTAGNWTCDSGVTPDNGTIIVFPYDNASAATTTTNNDLSASNVYSGIEFSGTCVVVDAYNYRIYDVTGNNIKVAGDVIAQTPLNSGINNYDCISKFDTGLIMSANGTIQRITLKTSLDIGANAVTLANVNMYDGGISGSGAITTTGFVEFGGSSSSFTGSTTITNGEVLAYGSDAFGASTATIKVGTGGHIGIAQTMTIPNAITVQSGATGYFARGEVQAGFDFGSTPTDVYGKNCDASPSCGSAAALSATFSGTVTLQQNTQVQVGNGAFIFSGTITGNGYSLTLYDPNTALNGSYGDLTITAGTNTSSTANGTYHSTRFFTTLSDTSTNELAVEALNTVTLNGQRAATNVADTGILGGTGTTGALTISNNGVVAPGAINNGVGTLHTSDLSIGAGGAYNVDLGGTGAGKYDQIAVTGTVTLGNQFDTTNSILNVHLINGYSPTLNDTFTIIQNDSTDAVVAPFDGLAEGATFTSEGVTYTISYVGGDGNDVTLKATTITGPPNTAGVIAKPVSIAVAGAVFVVGISLLVLRKKYLNSIKARR